MLLITVLKPVSALHKTVKKPPEILLAIPEPKVFPFWLRVRNFAQVVSNSLNIKLRIVTFDAAEYSRSHYANTIKQAILKQGKPDFIISMLWLNGQTNIFNLADHYEIPLITFNGSFNQKEKNKILPRKHHQYWYAHIAPNDELAGFELAEHLIKRYGNKPGNLIALSGDDFSAPSVSRIVGLKQSLANHPNIKLSQLIYTDWTSYDSKNRTLAIYDKQPIDLIWTASDFIAQGAIAAVEQKKGNLQKIELGSIDWNQESIDLIINGKLNVSFGGHFIEAGIALILAYDTLHGHDFSDEFGTHINTAMNIMHHKNVENIGHMLNFAHWKHLDFKHLSKTYNKQLQQYDLNVKSLLQY